MFEFNRLCNEYEKLTPAERGLALAEKSASVIRRLKALDAPNIDAVRTLAAFIVGSAVADGAVNEKNYLYIYPSLVKTFGNDFDLSAVKHAYKTADDVKKELMRHTQDLIYVIAQADEQLKNDIIMLCLLITAVDGKVSFKEKRYIRQLCKAGNRA